MTEGYCRTIHSSQGATVERTIVVGEAGRVATAQTAYVAASRERSGLRIITDDREKLSAAWSRWAERQSARSVLARGSADEPGRQRDMPVSDISRERARQKTLEQARQQAAEVARAREAALEKQAERQRSTREANHRQGRGMEI